MWLAPFNPRWRGVEGKRVWVIGASSGIGAALARELASRGAYVALSARTRARLDDVAAHCPKSIVLPLDVTDMKVWADCHFALQEVWGGIDLVVFCAAEYKPERAWETHAGDVRRMLEVNLASVYYGLETVLPNFLSAKQGGLAIVASVAGYMGLPNATVYGPSKAALINLAELLYADLHPRGVSVYLINPGFVRTPLTEKNDFAMPALQTPEQAAKAIVAGLAAGKFEIDFPKRFTRVLKVISMLPYRLRFATLNRALKLT